MTTDEEFEYQKLLSLQAEAHRQMESYFLGFERSDRDAWNASIETFFADFGKVTARLHELSLAMIDAEKSEP